MKKTSIAIISVTLLLLAFYLKKPVTIEKTIVIVYAAELAYHALAQDNFLRAANKTIQQKKTTIRSLSTPDVKDKMSCAATCETALDLQPSCIVVIGKVLSQIIGNLAKKRRSLTPIVFIGADTPIALGLVETLDEPGGMITGVFTLESDLDLCGKLLVTAAPTIKSVLIPYHSSNDISKSAERLATAISTYLESKNVKVRVFPIDTMAHAMNRIESVIHEHDLIMTLESDSLSEPYRSALIRLTNRHKIALFSGSQAAIQEGALFSYEVNPHFAAEAAFELVKKIIYSNQNPSRLSVVRLNSSREFIINTKRAQELGIPINVEQIVTDINTNPELAAVRNRVRVIMP